MKNILAPIALLLLVAFQVHAEDKAPRTDPEFAAKMANCGTFEVKAAELAKQKSSDSSVTSFAGHMTQDHGKANAELSALAKQKNWNLPESLDAKHQGKLDKLNGLSGASFDREYMAMMVKGHSKTADLFRGAATDATDADFKAWSAKTLAVVEQHLGHAETVSKKVGNAPVKASLSETREDTEPQGTSATTQDAQRQTDRAPGTAPATSNETGGGTKATTQDAQRQTDRAPGTAPVESNEPGGGTKATTQDAQTQTNRTK